MSDGLTTGWKAVVVIWEEPNFYFKRTTPNFEYMISDDEDNFPAGRYNDMSGEVAQDMIKRWTSVDTPVGRLIDFYGEPKWIGIYGSSDRKD